jgi:hypothetical protein
MVAPTRPKTDIESATMNELDVLFYLQKHNPKPRIDRQYEDSEFDANSSTAVTSTAFTSTITPTVAIPDLFRETFARYAFYDIMRFIVRVNENWNANEEVEKLKELTSCERLLLGTTRWHFLTSQEYIEFVQTSITNPSKALPTILSTLLKLINTGDWPVPPRINHQELERLLNLWHYLLV